jgi:hypothetical protein
MPLTWTSNGKVWMALHDDQWAKIQRLEFIAKDKFRSEEILIGEGLEGMRKNA